METEERLRERLQEAFATARADPALRARVIGGVAGAAPDGRRRPWAEMALGLVAGLTVALVGAGLIVTHRHAEVFVPGPARPVTPPGTAGGSLQVAGQVGFGCTLPVLIDGSAATVSLPDGAITDLPGAATVGRGPGGAAFSGGRWLAPIGAAVSPDGGSYAYTVDQSGAPGAGESSRIVVHDATTGREREVWRGGGYVQLAGWTGAGIVFVLQPEGDGLGVTEVRLVDPAHPDTARRIGPNPPLDPRSPHPGQLPLFTGTALIGAGAIWTTYDDQANGPTSPGRNLVARMDLRTGQVSTWYTAPAGSLARMVGLDARGLPVLVVSPATLVVLTGPGQAVTVGGADLGQDWTAAAGDAHGTWITSRDTLWLYSGGALERIGTLPPGTVAAVGDGLRVVGGCQ